MDSFSAPFRRPAKFLEQRDPIQEDFISTSILLRERQGMILGWSEKIASSSSFSETGESRDFFG
jgi:hypothetical protein